MKDTKRRIEAFSFFDYTGIARHLSKMAEKGWLIEKISNFGWVYRRIEPKKLTFSVCYYPKASEFDPEPTEEQKEFHEFCEHTGWVLAATSAQMQIFYNERENPVPIETDPALEIGTLHAAAKKSYIPAWSVLLLISVMNGALFVSRLLGDFIGLLASAANLFTGFGWLMLFILCVMELCGYFIWHKKAVKTAERGEYLETHSHSRIQKIIFATVMIGFAYWLLNIVLLGKPIMRTVGLLMVLIIAAQLVLVNGVKELLKRKKAPRGVTRTLTFLSSFVFAFAMMGAITFSVLRASQSGYFERDQETYEYNGATFTVYKDEIPLTVEDLINIQYDGYVRSRTGDESLLLGRFVMRQHPRFDAENYKDMPALEYTITEVKLPFLYEFCKNSLLNERKDEVADGQVVFAEHYEQADAAPWQANEAYQLYWSSGYLNKYLLCYDKRIVEITFFWEPTAEQMAIVADKLSE
ncbi:MAG: DUF2812 domain-containing protein [Oscillospiraceae bacterium]|nr:DUF2812 domain-containing protein [Oscillospiraceae bacterium]